MGYFADMAIRDLVKNVRNRIEILEHEVINNRQLLNVHITKLKNANDEIQLRMDNIEDRLSLLIEK